MVLEVQDKKAAWEKWDSQDHQGRRVSQVSLVDQEAQDSRDHLVSPEPKVNQVLQESDHLDQPDSRVSQASQDSQEVQDLKEPQDHPGSQVYQEDQVLKATLASQDSKAPPVSLAPKVSTVGPVPQVSLELRADQESLVDREDLDFQETRVRQVGMGSQDRLESKENQDFQDTGFPVLLGFQGYQALRETQVFLVPPAVPVSLALKETLALTVPLVLQDPAAPLGPQDRLCRALKDSKDPRDHLEEEVLPAQKVPVDPQGAAVFGERRVIPALPANPASLDRRERLVVQDSRVPLVFLVPQV